MKGYSSTEALQKSDHRWVLDGGSLKWENKKSLRLVVKSTDLKCMVYQSGPRDSIVVYNTSGYFDISQNIWKARGGKLTWEKVHFPKMKPSLRLGVTR